MADGFSGGVDGPVVEVPGRVGGGKTRWPEREAGGRKRREGWAFARAPCES